MIRESLPEDYPEMQKLQIECMRGLVGVADGYTAPVMQEWIDRIEGSEPRYDDYSNIVAVDEDMIVAFVSWRIHYTAHIECLYTKEVYRGQGIASYLLQEAERRLVLQTVRLRSTVNAQPFYEARGYAFVSNPLNSLFRVALLEKQL